MRGARRGAATVPPEHREAEASPPDGAAPFAAGVSIRLPTGAIVDVHVRPGEVVLLEGPNGSGKTTLLRYLAGLPPWQPWPAHERPGGPHPGPMAAPSAAQLLAQEARDTLAGLTAAGEFRLRGLRVPATLDVPPGRDVATLSTGEARRLALQVVAAVRPRLLLLDEPAEGLDPEGRIRLAAAVRDLASQGTAVVAADHTGLLRPLATRLLPLAPAAAPPRLPPVLGAAEPTAAPVAECPGGRLDRDGTTVELPAVRLGPGFHACVGPNGSGKSTLLLRLAGLLPSPARVQGERPRPGASVRLLLPQARDLFRHGTVEAELAGADRLGLVADALLARHPLALSGGEAQRVALAKTLGVAAPLYLLDEPDAHLDADGLSVAWEAIRLRVRQGACVLAVTHDARLAALAATRIHLGATAPSPGSSARRGDAGLAAGAGRAGRDPEDAPPRGQAAKGARPRGPSAEHAEPHAPTPHLSRRPR